MKTVKVRRGMSAAKLRGMFMFLNLHFFDNRIPGSMRVEFMKNCGNKESKKDKFKLVDAFFSLREDAIYLDDLLRFFPDYATICLLHEMVHVDLHFRGYEGYPIDKGHGTGFHAEIARLIKIGAYDGLL